MNVEVRLFATLRRNRFAEKTVDFPEGSTLGAALRQLGVGDHEVGILLLNGRSAAVDRPLQVGDVMAVFPPVGGG